MDKPESTIIDTSVMDRTPLARLKRDIRAASKTLGKDEVRFLISLYYTMQDERKALDNQLLQLQERKRPHECISFFSNQFDLLEGQIRSVLGVYAESSPLGEWAQSIVGIGPVISAGLLAHVDLERSTTVAKLWRYAGLDPTSTWGGREKSRAWVKEHGVNVEQAARAWGRNADTLRRMSTTNREGESVDLTATTLTAALARRPWNADFKRLCWNIGESFVKQQNHRDDVYGHLYVRRRAAEDAANERGDFAPQAARILAERNIDKSTDAYKAYSQGRLPPAHIYMRAKRWTVKLFLSHYHEMGYELILGRKAPAPYAIEMLKHVDYIGPQRLTR